MTAQIRPDRLSGVVKTVYLGLLHMAATNQLMV